VKIKSEQKTKLFCRCREKQVSISSTFYARIFRTKVFLPAFFYLHVNREKLLKRLLYKIWARKMLMKLTAGVNFMFKCSIFVQKSLEQLYVLIIWFFNFMAKGNWRKSWLRNVGKIDFRRRIIFSSSSYNSVFCCAPEASFHRFMYIHWYSQPPFAFVTWSLLMFKCEPIRYQYSNAEWGKWLLILKIRLLHNKASLIY